MRVAIDGELLFKDGITDTGNVELIKSLYVLDQNIEFFILAPTAAKGLAIGREVELDWILQPKRRDYFRDAVDIYITKAGYQEQVRSVIVLRKGEYERKK